MAGIVGMKKKGVRGQSLVKKRRYWPKGVPGDDIDEYMANKNVGDCCCFEFKWTDEEQTSYFVYALKEPDYVTKIISTHGTTDRPDSATTRRTVDGNAITFKLPEPFYRHFQGRHSVDDHNNRRGGSISFDKSWGTKYWLNRHYAFQWAMSETNANLIKATAHNKSSPEGQVSYRQNLAMELLNNRYGPDGELLPVPEVEEVSPRKRAARHISDSHQKMTVPKNKGKYQGDGRWKEVETEYLQMTCSAPGCKKRKRTYCSCNPYDVLCDKHFAEHIAEKS